jgi:CRISPR/Cas system-associated exonuclease Cas4 (RecB family)
MRFFFSKTKFVSVCNTCNKYAWLDKNHPDDKKPIDEYTEVLFENGHKVGDLAKEYFKIDVDVAVLDENGKPNLSSMLEETKKALSSDARVIAEASFEYDGLFCSVDILVKNDDGSYDINEVKSSKRDLENQKKRAGVKQKYIIDAAYQQYILERLGYKINNVYVVLLSDNYVRGKTLDLEQYFIPVPVTTFTTALQTMVKDKLTDVAAVLDEENEPTSVFNANCKNCDYFAFCSRNIPSPSVFDIYEKTNPAKHELYNSGVSFFDAPLHTTTLYPAARKQIEYYNRPGDAYIDKDAVKEFLDSLSFPVYSLDFETYQAVVPEHEGMKVSEVVPFQYSLHVMKKPDGDYREGSADLEERHFIDISGGDPRRAIAERLVNDIPFGSCVIAYHESTERNIIERLAELYPDLADHLLSFGYINNKGEKRYKDPLPLFKGGHYYTSAMGNKFSIKSVLPSLYPDDPAMDYHNLEGSVKNGTQAMVAITKARDVSDEERREIEADLIKYCALDTYAVVKVLKKLYDVTR